MSDKGHDVLIHDIRVLLKDAEEYQFHDFKNSLYSSPKRALVAALESVISKSKGGFYDN